jgi:hypothetical protein
LSLFDLGCFSRATSEMKHKRGKEAENKNWNFLFNFANAFRINLFDIKQEGGGVGDFPPSFWSLFKATKLIVSFLLNLKMSGFAC